MRSRAHQLFVSLTAGVLLAGCGAIFRVPSAGPAPRVDMAASQRARLFAQAVDNPRHRELAGVIEGGPYAYLLSLAASSPPEPVLRREMNADWLYNSLLVNPEPFRGEVISGLMHIVTLRRRKVRVGGAADLVVYEGIAMLFGPEKTPEWYEIRLVERDGEAPPRLLEAAWISGRFLKTRLYVGADDKTMRFPLIVGPPPTSSPEPPPQGTKDTLSAIQRFGLRRWLLGQIKGFAPAPGTAVDARPVIDLPDRGPLVLDGEAVDLKDLAKRLADWNPNAVPPAVVIRVGPLKRSGSDLLDIIKAAEKAGIRTHVIKVARHPE